MRIGNKKMFYFILFFLIILLSNIAYFHVLSLHSMVITIIGMLIIFHFLFIFEKERVRYERKILAETIIFIIGFFILYFLLGIFIGIKVQNNYYTWQWISSRTLPLLIYIILREILRYNIVRKISDDKVCMFLSILLLILMDLSCSITYAPLNTKYEVLRFITVTLNPIIAKNISYSYIINNTGYKPILFFDILFTMYPYILPFVPNPSEYMASIINMLAPVLYVFRIERFYSSKEKYTTTGQYYKKKLNDFFIPVTIAIILVYFFSGYFRYYAIAVASQSMSPTLELGDLVILDQKQKNLKEDDIIAYKRKDKIIIHRINKIASINNVNYYYTKGDNNEHMDDIVIEPEMIIGKVKFKVPYVGYPTVWFNKE